MKKTLYLAAILLMAVPPSRAQDRPLTPDTKGEIVGGARQAYTFAAKAGDMITGKCELKGKARPDVSPWESTQLAWFVVVDPRGKTVSKSFLWEGEQPIGFIAPLDGTYRIEIVAGSVKEGSYAIHVRTHKPAEAAKVAVAPTVRYSNSRVTQLAKEVQAGQTDALSRFWSDAAAAHGVFVEPIQGDDQNFLATFLWRETYETHNVRLGRPPYSRTSMDYYLTRLPGTDVWYKTMKVHRTTRFVYSFFPNDLRDENVTLSSVDPLNPRLYPADIDHSDWTPDAILELPGAPDDSWAARKPTRRGSLVPRTFDSPLLKARMDLSVYTPPDYAAVRGPYPLVVLFDGFAFAGDVVAAPAIVDNLIGAGKIRPPIVCFLSSTTSAAGRMANLQLNPTFADAIATEIVPWLRTSLAVSTNPKDLVVGGFSAGGLAGFFIALKHPEVFGNVLAQDGGGAGNVGTRLRQMFHDAPKATLRIYMASTIYGLPDLPVDELALAGGVGGVPRSGASLLYILQAKGYEVVYRETGATHDWLYVRTTLPEALIALLGSQ